MAPRNGTTETPAPVIEPDTGEKPSMLAIDDAMAHVRRVSRESGSSFLAGIRILPRERRDAMFAIYAFCREVDDIADDPYPLAEKQRMLTDWRGEIDRIFAGSPETLTGRALLGPIAAYGLARRDFLDLIDGMEMDAEETATKGPSLEVLDLYCDRVASAVGRLSVRVFGDDGPAAQDLAHALGRALQLTNILRDIQEDAERDRLYLPDDLLRKHGIETRRPSEVMAHPALPAACEDLADIAALRYEEAQRALEKCSRRAIRPAVLMMHIYARVLDGLRARGWARLDERVRVSMAGKLWILLRYGLI